jgi:ATP sulfurylase
VRDEVRARVGDFIEVFVDCPLEELLKRDVKGLYARALRGEIANFTGVSDPYEAPLHPEVHVDTAAEDVGQSVSSILAALQARGYLEDEQMMPGRVRLADLPEPESRTPTPYALHPMPHGGVLQVRQASPERVAELDREAVRLPQVELDAWALSDLELLASGALSPLTGFMREADTLSVGDRMRLSDGMVWSLPVLLPVTEEQGRELKTGARVALSSDGQRLAILTVSEAFAYDREHLAADVYGKADAAHPGVARMLQHPGWALAGPVEVIRLGELPFSEHRRTPSETRATFDKRGWRSVVGFQTRNPVHRAHEYLQKVALEQVDGLLLHPLVGETKDDDIPAATRMRCYETLMQHHYPRDRVVLAVFPASMRYAGPREAIFHALVRKNYGCTHFIVGRDHAGVGKYYGTYDAQEIFDSFDPAEIGIEILKFEHAFYCRACAQMATTRTCPHGDAERVILSGTRVRQMLRSGEDLPIEFTRPEIAAILRQAELEAVTARSPTG